MIKRLIIVLIMILCMTTTANAKPSLDRLIGSLDLNYNIRNDILTYINNSVPILSSPWKALIKIAQNQNFLYYSAKTYSEASQVVTENSVAQRCLNMSYNDDRGYTLFKHIEDMMGDTQERRDHIFSVSTYFFSRNGFEHKKIKTSELTNMCESGNYG